MVFGKWGVSLLFGVLFLVSLIKKKNIRVTVGVKKIQNKYVIKAKTPFPTSK